MSSLFDELMAKKEAEEKANTIEVQMDPNDPSSWSEEMIADYFVWVLRKKGERFVEPIIEMLLDKLR